MPNEKEQQTKPLIGDLPEGIYCNPVVSRLGQNEESSTASLHKPVNRYILEEEHAVLPLLTASHLLLYMPRVRKFKTALQGIV